MVNNWGPYYIRTVQSVMDGSWKSEDYWGGLADDVIQIVGLSSRLTEEQRAKVEATIAAIHSGELHPFTGPLKDQSGTLRVPEGKVMTKEELAGMDWYVEGIDATLPN